MTTKVTNIYNLKLTPSQFGQNSIVVNCSQYDSLFRVIQFNLFNGNSIYSIPEGSVVTIRGTKKDNTGFEYECDYSNNVVTFPLQQQITIFPGKVPSELRITKEGEIIGSWNFLFLVEESPLSDDTTISETQLPLLEQAIEAAGRLNEAFDDITEFTDETYPNAVQAIQSEGATQVSNVTNEGTTQRGLVSSEGATQIVSIQAEGTTQKGLVTSEGTTQVANVQAKGTEVLGSIPSDYTELSEEVADIRSDLDTFITEVTGRLIPPQFALGSRYVNNGADTWATNNVRMSFKQGTYISLSQGDVVSKTSADIYTFSGGYSTDNGATFTSIVNRSDDFTAPADGIYFFCLAKRNDAVFTDEDLALASTYLSFTGTSSDSIEGRLSAVETETTDLNESVDGIKDAVGYEIAPLVPSDYLTFPNTNKGLNYQGNLVDDTAQDATDFIEIDGLYDIFRIVSNETKWSLGVLCYYTESKQFIRRDLLGATYDFSIYNGEKGVWLGIDKTVANAKYIRYSGDNARGFKYWEVRYGAKASAFDEYYKYPFLGKKIVNFGDSIFGQTRPPKDVSTYLAEKTGATVYNAGFGGCEMSTHADSNYNPFSMCNIADAIVSGTWASQESASSQSGMPAYFAETVTMLKALDFSTVDIITISYGTNDWNNSSPLDNGGNSNMAYFADALRHSIETLLTAFPQLRIFVCTPIYRWWMDSQGQFTDDSNTRVNQTTNTKLTDFVAKTIEVAEEYQLPYINNYEIGMNRYNRLYYFYPTDGTHPKPIGNELIADHIAKEIY